MSSFEEYLQQSSSQEEPVGWTDYYEHVHSEHSESV